MCVKIAVEDYVDFLNVTVFNQVDNTNSDLKQAQSKVNDICWMVCAAKFTKKLISDENAFKLWQIFNYFVELDDEGVAKIPLAMDFEEVELLLKKLNTVFGRPWESEALDRMKTKSELNKNEFDLPLCGFQTLLTIMEFAYLADLDDADITEMFDELHEEIVGGVVMKGQLSKKGEKRTTWKTRWFILKPDSMKYYVSRDLSTYKGEIAIPECQSIESISEKVGDKKLNRFCITCGNRKYELMATDLKTRNAWITALKEVRKYFVRDKTLQQCLFEKRRLERLEKRLRLRDEEQAKLNMEKQLHEQRRDLEAEKEARVKAEDELKEEAAQRELESEKRKELEEIKNELELLLEEERQAKRDEEIVRNLQARILKEEVEAREALEKLKAEQDEQILSEKSKREELEQLKEEQELALQLERDRLQKLESERKEAEEKLKEAAEKLLEANKAKQSMQAKFKRVNNDNFKLPIFSHRGYTALVDADHKIKQYKQRKLSTDELPCDNQTEKAEPAEKSIPEQMTSNADDNVNNNSN
ncbi:uncharacterized protein LOC141900332 isoform X2 [Tubulanus polymorphus]|uniref:uncharacterized protein LOC141900332 isoform X2 n=1 Tax=Tubulanus polymorphus TaxID=672921 RepID=UPI003DA4A608